MLQQTQVKTVVPYYERFLARFPDVESLAEAEVDEVLALWSGLGYYRRARQLHRAAREVVARGGFPGSARGLRELPGIGPYTAAAVASIAFGEVVPVLDGNVERLLSRLHAFAGDPKKSAARAVLLDRARGLLDATRPGDSNQALMELGATVCTPRGPRCDDCPLAAGCRGRGEPERYPSPRRRRPVERVAWSVALVERRGRTLLYRRPRESEILAGLWELPNAPHEADPEAVERALRARYGGEWRLEEASFVVRHGVTYRSFELHVHRAAYLDGGDVAEGPEAAWVTPAKRPDYAVPAMFEKVLVRSREARGNSPSRRRR